MCKSLIRFIASILVACLIAESLPVSGPIVFQTRSNVPCPIINQQAIVGWLGEATPFRPNPRLSRHLYENLKNFSRVVRIKNFAHWPKIGMLLAVGYYSNAVILGTSLRQNMNFLQFLLSMYFFSFLIITAIATLQLSFDSGQQPIPFRLSLLRQNLRAIWAFIQERPRWFLRMVAWGILLQYVDTLLFYSALFKKWVTPNEFAVLDTSSISASPFYERWRKSAPIHFQHLVAGAAATLSAILITGISTQSIASDSPYHFLGIGMILLVAVILAASVSERVWLKISILDEMKTEPHHPIIQHFSAMVSFIDYASTSLLYLITGLLVNSFYLHQPLYQWHPRMLLVSTIFATGWYAYYYFQTKLTTSQWLVIFSTLPSWTLFWTWWRGETAITPRHLAGVAISTLAVFIGTGLIKGLFSKFIKLRPSHQTLLDALRNNKYAIGWIVGVLGFISVSSTDLIAATSGWVIKSHAAWEPAAAAAGVLVLRAA